MLTGEPGIGKTALLQYAAEVAANMQVRTVTGIESERDLPFAGLAQLLRVTPSDLDRLPEPQAQALGVALALRPGSGVDRFAVGAGLLTLLSHRSEDQPICLLIDDAHLLDGPSQEALAFAARRLLADAVALIAAARSGEACRLVDADLPSTELDGIGVDGTRAMVDRSRTVTTGDFSRRIHSLTGGNPLAIQELISSSDALRTLPPDAPAPIPAELSALYARRATDLDPATVTAVMVAAAAGEDLATITRACARLGISVNALAAAEEAGLISVTEDRVRFEHPLIRSGLYASASPSRRRELHAVIADVLSAVDADRRAWHRCAATLGLDEATAAEMEDVGRRAADRGAHSVAAAAAERAASLTPDDTVRARRWLAAGTWAWEAGEGVRARESLERAARLDPSPQTVATQLRLKGVIAARCGALDEARDVLLAAGAASADASEQVVCYAEAVNACFYLGDAAHALLAAERIEAVVDGADSRAGVLGLVAAGMGRILAGQDGARLIRKAVQRPQATEPYHVGGLDDASWRAIAPLYLRDSGIGRAMIESVVAERRAQSAIGTLPHLLFNIARDEATTDRWSHAEADYSEAIGLAREFGQTTELAMSLAGLAWLEARLGRGESAVGHASEALDLSAEFRVHLGRIWTEMALGDLALGAGDAATAADRYGAIEATLSTLGVLDVDLSPGPELVEARLRLGDRDGAGPLADGYSRRAADKGQPWAMARAARSRALLADDGEFDDVFAEALELHAATVDLFEEARTLLALGSRRRRARRRIDGRIPLRRALDIFTQLGARPWAGAAADELTATGMTVTKPGESAASQLTPRELQIARLLADHKTTRQVATALFLSPKTVEYHLRHIYAKFAIDSRADLIRRMSENDHAAPIV